MERKSFLQALAGALAARPTLSLKKETVKQQSEMGFDPKHQYGNAVLLTEKDPIDHAKQLILDNARSVLPKGTPFYLIEGPELKALNKLNQDGFYVAWLYNPTPLGADFTKRILGTAIA